MPSENELAMLRAARSEGINDRNELANLMAQLGHESGGFRTLEEGFRYTRGIDQIPVAYARREGVAALERARLAALEGQPQELARLMYGGRMGNDDAGDGYRYRGRGFTQLTGEENYRNAGRALGLDLLANPDLAAERENASRIALWYWRERVPAAERDDVTAATRRVNGGAVGLQDRHARFDAWHALLTPAFIADVDAGRVRAGDTVGPLVGRDAMQDGALRRFERGADVTALQTSLRGLEPQRRPALQVTGQFDAATEQAVRRFQEGAGLPVTGRADPGTLDAIERATLERRPPNEVRPGGAPRAAGTAEPEAQLAANDRRLLAGIRRCVSDLDAQHGRTFDDASERACWALLPLAKQRGITEPQQAVVSIAGSNTRAGEYLFLVQGALDDPAKLRVQLNTMQAMQTPIDDSLARVHDVAQQQSLAESQRLQGMDNERGQALRQQV